MQIIYYRDKCIGCNYCVEAWPGRWQMSKRDGKCVLIGSRIKGQVHRAEVGEYELELNKQAAEVCPVNIIRLEE
ncbi:MAG: ferredoxin [Balneolaceae bacterium]